MFFFFFKQKTAYEMRISDWSSDVCSSDLWIVPGSLPCGSEVLPVTTTLAPASAQRRAIAAPMPREEPVTKTVLPRRSATGRGSGPVCGSVCGSVRSEEHTSELQSLMRISYAVFCLKKKIIIKHILHTIKLRI